MILHSKNIALTKLSFDECTIRTKMWVECDYCFKHFQKDKKSIIRGRKTIDKDCCNNKACISRKKIDVCQIKYGSDHYFQSKDFKNKSKATNIEKYNSEQYFKSYEFQKNKARLFREKYGVDSPLQVEEFKIKQQTTCKDKYGVKNYSQHPNFVNQLKQTNLEKYGVESVMQLDSCKEARRNTCLERYGVENYTQTSEYWHKRKATCLTKYGVEHPHQLDAIKNKRKQTMIEKYGVENYAQLDVAKEQYKETCYKRFGVPNPLCLQDNRKFGATEEQLRLWINSIGCNFQKNYDILSGKELDCFDESRNVAIEYCGIYWHNEMSPTPRDKKYHYAKHTICENKGIKLFTIFSDEWCLKMDICKSIIESYFGIFDYRIGARECEVRDITKDIYHDFCNAYHLLGSSKLTLHRVGIFYKNSLVGVMSLGRHPRKSNNIILDRLCFKKGYQIIGGASKLLKQCVEWSKFQNYNTIITWSDNRWSNGGVYKGMGFKLDADLPPDYSYVNINNCIKRISKQSQKKSLTNCPDGKTEREWAMENNLARIWDCGKKRWILNIKY